ncbi:AbrB/MazE/SpoVT family DNA-binding domain-containing protein [Trichlorobacter ammonificans]|uniref:AbrB family transcriptional regulator n=1 Tax=Trichlorobacter ammonificans TaxID=2916410 RepID=A0ABM9D7V9_9BACT|nr:AbrB/MazE/SpoVT family DNA-binding domain-containing protein [Trichlorobacter ammonificans]CAH2031295.1 AbrB family transcriptional regulator [Trichlorobacter ammonificans]
MNAVAISPKFQVAIPKDVRNQLHLVPGQMMQVTPCEGRIEIIPERSITEMCGFRKTRDASHIFMKTGKCF